jgi:phosphoribosylaminoimidazolecarboxamide formyltransferase/IMP cyclohydrolase
MHKRNALVSVTDKSKLEDFTPLIGRHWNFISTGGSWKALKEIGIQADAVEDVADFAPILDGRVKTLHPVIHGGILAERDNTTHMAQLKKAGIELIDLVVVNLYDFNANPDIEHIDIGGVALLRGAAKNWRHTTALCDPADYRGVVAEIQARGLVSSRTRHRLATKAWKLTSSYDTAIHAVFEQEERDLGTG